MYSVLYGLSRKNRPSQHPERGTTAGRKRGRRKSCHSVCGSEAWSSAKCDLSIFRKPCGSKVCGSGGSISADARNHAEGGRSKGTRRGSPCVFRGIPAFRPSTTSCLRSVPNDSGG